MFYCSAEKAPDPPLLSRFVTHRKRTSVQAQKHTSKRVVSDNVGNISCVTVMILVLHHLPITTFFFLFPQSVGLHHTLNSSDDFHPSLSRNKRLVTMKPLRIENSDTRKKGVSSRKRVALGEVSFNDSDDQHLIAKRPLLSSTPSVVCRQLLHLPEPSISEISSLSFDEPQQPANNISAPGMKNVSCEKRRRPPNPPRERVMEEGEGGEESVVEVTPGDGVEDQGKEGGVGGSSAQGFGCVSSPPHLESLAKELKER